MSATQHPNLFAALSAAQAEFHTLIKDSENPHFRSKFAGLDTVVEESAPILSKHGLAFMGRPSYDDAGNPTFRYTLGHESGQREDGEMLLLLAKNDPQGQGSALTYARRYAICAVLNLVADEDDDGEGAARHEAPPRAIKAKAKAKAKPAADTIPPQEVADIARLYAASGWKGDKETYKIGETDFNDEHRALRMQLSIAGAGYAGEIGDVVKALKPEQAALVRSALEGK